jgi:uncharacterized YccA/Bax inhibitor family protein
LIRAFRVTPRLTRMIITATLVWLYAKILRLLALLRSR